MATKTQPIISFDNDMYFPKTYVLNFMNETTKEIAKEALNYFLSLDFIPASIEYELPKKTNLRIGPYSYIILAEFDDSYLITTQESVLENYIIGMIPKFSYSDVEQDFRANSKDLISKIPKTYEEKVIEESRKKYKYKIKNFRMTKNVIMEQIYLSFENHFYKRYGHFDFSMIFYKPKYSFL